MDYAVKSYMTHAFCITCNNFSKYLSIMCEITLLWGEIAALSGKQFVTLAWMMTHIDYYELLIVVI